MKKTLLIVFALILTNTLVAQEWGIRAGVDFANARQEIASDSENFSGTGFYIGFFGEFFSSKSFAFRPEINYLNLEIEDGKFDQISIPILAQLSTSESFHLLAGPNFGFLLDTEEGVDSFNMGLDFGVAYNFTESLALEGRYTLGLTNLYSGIDAYDAKLKLGGFIFGLAYEF